MPQRDTVALLQLVVLPRRPDVVVEHCELCHQDRKLVHIVNFRDIRLEVGNGSVEVVEIRRMMV